MDHATRERVVVVYAHALLGEGLASMLNAEAGVEAVAVASADRAARHAALEQRPALVIVEEADERRSFEAAGSLPVVFVRLAEDGATRVGQPLADPDSIVALTRDLIAQRRALPAR